MYLSLFSWFFKKIFDYSKYIVWFCLSIIFLRVLKLRIVNCLYIHYVLCSGNTSGMFLEKVKHITSVCNCDYSWNPCL